MGKKSGNHNGLCIYVPAKRAVSSSTSQEAWKNKNIRDRNCKMNIQAKSQPALGKLLLWL